MSCCQARDLGSLPLTLSSHWLGTTLPSISAVCICRQYPKAAAQGESEVPAIGSKSLSELMEGHTDRAKGIREHLGGGRQCQLRSLV